VRFSMSKVTGRDAETKRPNMSHDGEAVSMPGSAKRRECSTGVEFPKIRHKHKGQPKTLNHEKEERPYERCLGHAVDNRSGFEAINGIACI